MPKPATGPSKAQRMGEKNENIGSPESRAPGHGEKPGGGSNWSIAARDTRERMVFSFLAPFIGRKPIPGADQDYCFGPP